VSATPRALAASQRLYALLLRAYPAAFRAGFGEEMRLLFGDSCRDAWGSGGARALAALWTGTLLDFVTSCLREHAQAWRESMNTKGITGIALLLVSAGLITHDAVSADASMGIAAILVTAVTAAAGAVLVSHAQEKRRAA